MLRRVLIRLVACAAVGVLLTYAVAWAVVHPRVSGPRGAWQDAEVPLPVRAPTDWPRMEHASVRRARGLEEIRYNILFIVEARPGSGEVEFKQDEIVGKVPGAIASVRIVDLTVERTGWPRRAVQHERWRETEEVLRDGRGKVARTVGHPTSVWSLGVEVGNGRVGIKPVFPGFLVNAGVFAGVLFLMWVGPGVVRRRVRVWRGRCVGCGYVVEGEVCSECGEAVTQ